MNTFKRILIVGLTIIIIAILIVTGLNYARAKLRHFFGIDYMTDDELCETFRNNQFIFENSANILSKDYFDDIGYCRIEKKHSDSGQNVPLKKRIKIVIPDNKELDKNIKKELNNSDLWVILKKLDFDYIIVDPDGIFFVNRANLGFTIGILYTELDVSDGVYRCEFEEISKNWYLCVSE